MDHQNPSEEKLRDILTKARTIAMVGASSDPNRPSFRIMQQLLEAGYKVIPVNPTETEVHGQRAYPSLLDVPDKVDIVDVFRRAEFTPGIAEEAIAIGAPVLWLQLGISNEEAARKAEAAGLTVIMDRCLGKTHRELGIGRR